MWLVLALERTAHFATPQVDLHYNGFCNSVLWQLFHYVPLNTDTKLSETRTLQFQWNAYQDANRYTCWAGSIFDHIRNHDAAMPRLELGATL